MHLRTDDTLRAEPRCQNIGNRTYCFRACPIRIYRNQRARPLIELRQAHDIKPRRLKSKLRIQILPDDVEFLTKEPDQRLYFAQRFADVHADDAVAAINTEQNKLGAQKTGATYVELFDKIAAKILSYLKNGIGGEDRL